MPNPPLPFPTNYEISWHQNEEYGQNKTHQKLIFIWQTNQL